MNDNNITDVDFKEVPTNNEVSEDAFDPADYLISALQSAGHPDPTAWTKDMDPRARTALEEKDRIFFANRAIRLYLAEQGERENITPRLLLAEGIGKVKWAALMEQGVVPWLMNKFDAKGKIIKDTPAIDAADLEGKEVTITANDGGPIANEDGSARQVGDFVLEPSYKENDVAVAEVVETAHAQRQTPGVYIKLEDNDPDPHGTIETIMAERINSISKESRASAPNTNDPLYIGTFLSQESFEQCVDPKNFEDGSWANVNGVRVDIKDGSTTHLWGNIHPNDMPVILGVDTGTEVLPPADENGNSFENCKAVTPQRGEVEGLTPLNEFGNPVGTRSLTKLDIDPKHLDVK